MRLPKLALLIEFLEFSIMSRLLILIVIAQSALYSEGAGLSKVQQVDFDRSANFSYRAVTKDLSPFHDPTSCNLPASLINEIKSYQTTVNRIILEATQNSFKGRTYKELAQFVDKFGDRLSGSQTLEDSIDFILEKMKADGLTNVHGEEAVVPHWVRGEERAEMISPRHKNLPLLGLGTSVGTPPEGITADVWVVKSFDELRADPGRAQGKIIVYNQPWIDYGSSNLYRTKGASEASRVGALAVLTRSIAPFSLDTPHTGGQNYDPDVTHIPAACISIEDAELLNRIQDSGDRIQIHVTMLDYNLPLTTSRNAIGELRGREFPWQSVILSGHIDSWDVGQGAMDDGGGCYISTEALALLKSLNLIPRRTLRAIMWTSEEVGLWGAQDYARHHMFEMENITAAFESDGGTFTPKGLDFAGSEEAGCIVYEILKLLQPIQATEYAMYASVSTDIGHLISKGVPGLSLNNANDQYFWYHHTQADTMNMMDSDDLDKGTAVFAAAAYVIADLTDPLPRRIVT